MSEPVREPTSAPDGDATRCDAPLAVLLVEDNPGDAGLLQALLDEGADAGRAGGTPRTVSVRWVQRLSAAREALADGGPVDVVLLDLTLPDARGMDTVSQMRAAAPSLPVVVLTGLDDEALALRAMQAGAQDYLVKGAFTGAGLHRALHRAVERQRLVDAARRATAARDLVLGVVAHDLRDPLSAIKMCAGALGRTPTAESVGELAGVVRESAEWMERIIRDLLDVTTIEAGRLAVERGPLSAAAVAEQLRTRYTPLAAERGCALRCEVARALPPVDADGERLAQALGNLLGNAIKFTPRGGTVELAVAPSPAGGVRFEVRDTGPGIPAEHLPHLFDRFWQARETRRAGAGLGLAIAQGIAQAHGSVLAVESTPGSGTRFWFDLAAAG
jgi:signal transduction histidine kinase